MTTQRRHGRVLLFAIGIALFSLALAGCGGPRTSGSAITTLSAGENALNRGDCTAANADFAQFLSQSPGNVTALEGEAECYSNSGLWGKAIAILVSLPRVNRSFQTYYNLATDYWHQGDLGNAYSALISAASSPGYSSLGIIEIAQTANQWQGYRTSLSLLKLIPISSWNSQAFLIAGADSASLGSNPQATSYFTDAAALSTSGQKGNIYFQIGNYWYNSLDYTQAISSYQQAIKAGNISSASSDYEVLYVQLANAEVNNGLLHDGELEYYNALRYATSAVQKDADKLQIGELMLQTGDIQNGRKLLESLTGTGTDPSVRQQALSALHSLSFQKPS